MKLRTSTIVVYALSNALFIALAAFLLVAPFLSEKDAVYIAPVFVPAILLLALFRGVTLVIMKRNHTDFKHQLHTSGHTLLARTFPDKNYMYQVITYIGVGSMGLAYWVYVILRG